MGPERILAALVTAVLAWLVPSPAAAQPVDLGAYGVPIRFEAPPGVTFEVADEGRFVDTLVARLAPDGDLVLVNDLPMQEYVMGIAEMPSNWPMEALKAQAVAARTYAWYQTTLGTFLPRGYDICATTACQVFDGRAIVETPLTGQRWREAVETTAGEVIVHQGGPILARYFSTSGGATRNNEHVFPSEGPRPYLKSVPDPTDDVSPLHRWRVTFPRDDFDELLSRGETLSGAVPVARIDFVPAAETGRTDAVRVISTDGDTVEVSASAFRAFVSDQAHARFPDRYPSERADGRRLPTTLPSSRFTVEVLDDEVVVDGRGWGHGVGMSQWGARGRADDGASYDDILRHYYTGVGIGTPAALPDRIRVGITSRDAAGGAFEVTADGPFRVVAGDTVITERGLGTWTLGLRADRTIGLDAPTGYGAPLVVAPTEVSRTAPTEVEIVTLETVVNKPAELELRVTDATGAEVLHRPLGIVEAGRHGTSWSLDTAEGAAIEPGSYEVALLATDEDEAVGGASAAVEVRALRGTTPPSLLDARPPAPPATDATPLIVAGLLGAAAGAAAGSAVPLGRRRGPRRG